MEILDTNVENINDLTVCGRFKNPFLAAAHDIWQNIVYISSFDIWLLAKVVIIDCDDRYDGCNDYYRAKIGRTYMFHSKMVMQCQIFWIYMNIFLFAQETNI